MTIKEFRIQYALGSLSWQDHYMMAANSKTPKEILRILSKDTNYLVRVRARHNPSNSRGIPKVALLQKENMNLKQQLGM